MVHNQNNLKALRYFPVLIFGVIACISFIYDNITSYSLLIFSFGLIPLLELFIKPSKQPVVSQHHYSFDQLFYSILLIQYGLLFVFVRRLSTMEFSALFSAEGIGLLLTMGILNGVYGINVAHELGHRKEKRFQLMAKALLLTSLYMHFFIEHNRGHHKRVGTLEDPATARRDESLYTFWIRSTVMGFLSAARLESDRLKRLGHGFFHWKNEWLRYQLIQISLIILIYLSFGLTALVGFILSAIIGFLLLETINYVEHYGLFREKNEFGVYSRVAHHHSWNSDHILGRYLLFELSRHSDHHHNSSKTYPTLISRGNETDLPTGYPGMMLLALLPPLWFRIMNKRLKSVT